MSTTASWNTGSGNWFNASSWDEPNPSPPPPTVHHVPTANEDVQIADISGVGTPYTITYNGASTINSLNGAGNYLIDITGGSLTVANGGQSNATLINVASGAALNVNAGILQIHGGDFAGTISGAGGVVFTVGTFNFNAGANLAIDSLTLGVLLNGTVSTTNVNADLSYAHDFTLADTSGNHAVLNLNNHTFTLSGNANLDGTVTGPGTLRVSGSAVEGSSGYGNLTVKGGATVEYASGSTALQHLSVVLGDASTDGTIRIDSGSQYTIDGSVSLGNGAAHSIVGNAGTLRASAASVTINAAFANTGTLTVDAGDTLFLGLGASSANTLGGTLAGAGKLVLGTGSTALNSTHVTVAQLALSGGNGGSTVTLGNNLTYAGVFSFDNQFDTLDLNGHTLTLSGSTNTLSSNDAVGGTIKVTGAAIVTNNFTGGGPNFTGAALTLQNAGAITQTGTLNLNGTLLNDAGRTYAITTASNINLGGTGSSVTNNGTLSDTAAGTSTISGALASTGTISVASGATLVLNGGVQTIGGTLSGAGSLVFGFAADATINTTNVTVSQLSLQGGNGGAGVTLGNDLVYAGTLAFAGAFDTLFLNGHTLTLSGEGNSLLGNQVDGAGKLLVTGSATIGHNISLGTSYGADTPMTLQNSGTVTQDGNVSLNGTLLNDAGHTYTIAGAGFINGIGDGATITNNGTFAIDGAGQSDFSATFDNNGALSVGSDATLILHGSSTLGGTVSGAGTLVFGSGASTMIDTGDVTVANLVLDGGIYGGTTTLGVDLTYSGAFTLDSGFATLALNGHSLSLTGTTNFPSGTISGLDGAADALSITGGSVDLSKVNFSHWTAGEDTITITGTAGDDALIGSSQNDTLIGGAGNDGLTGGAGDDHLTGGARFDTLVGGAGNDVLDGGANPDNQGDIMLGGAGDDTYYVDSTLDLVDEGFVFPDAGWGGTDTIISTANWYWDVESVGEIDRISEDAADPNGAGVTFVGGIFDNTLIGHSGTDILFGRGGNDIYIPGDGVDWISLSTLGLTDQNAYAGVDGHNTIIATPRGSGPSSYDIMFEFDPAKDKVDVSAYHQYASGADVLSHAVDDGAGNSYIALGDGLDYLYFVGLTKAELNAADFVA